MPGTLEDYQVLSQMAQSGLDNMPLGPIDIRTPEQIKRDKDLADFEMSRQLGLPTQNWGGLGQALSPGGLQLKKAQGLPPISVNRVSVPELAPLTISQPQTIQAPRVPRLGASPSMKDILGKERELASIDAEIAKKQADRDRASEKLLADRTIDSASNLLDAQKEEDQLRKQISDQMVRYKQALQSVPDGVDDKRWFKNRTGIGQVFAGLGVLMGAVAQAIQPQRRTNAAIDMINGYIDRDIQLQLRENESKKWKVGEEQNALGLLYKQLGDKEAANNLLDIRQTEAMKNGLKAIQAGRISDESSMMADKIMKQLELRQATTMHNMAAKAAAAAQSAQLQQAKQAQESSGLKPLSSSRSMQAKVADEESDYFNADQELMTLVQLRKGTTMGSPGLFSSTKRAYNAQLETTALAAYKNKTGAVPNVEAEADRAIRAYSVGFKPMGSQLSLFEQKRKQGDATYLRKLLAKRSAGIDVSAQLKAFQEYQQNRPSINDLAPLVIGDEQ